MKVLILNHELTPLGGGAGRAADRIAAHLARRGHRVTCVTANANGQFPRRERREGYDIERVPGFRKNAFQNRLLPTFASYLTLGFLRAAAECRRDRPDVVHAFFTVPAGLAAAGIRRMFGIPFVVSLRGSDVPGHSPGNTLMRRLRGLAAAVWRRADAVVALSAGLLATARETAPLVDALYIHNGVDVQAFAPPADGRAGRQGDLRLVCVARLERLKGIHVLLPVLARLSAGSPPFRLRIVGDGPEREALTRQVRELGLDSRVEFAGAVAPDRMAAEYAAADVLVHPTLAEAFGQVLTEAMACGLPVLATRVGGIPEVVEDGVNGWLIPAADAEALAARLDAVLRLPREDLRKIGAVNRSAVISRFSWESVAAQYEDLYRKVVAHSEGPAA